MNHQLPDDISRCRDSDCPTSTTCLRWLQRDKGSFRLVSAESLFPFHELSVVTDQCPYYLEASNA